MGPIVVSASDYTFGGLPDPPLLPDTNYRIIVVATSTSGISIKQMAVVTGGVAPVLNPLQITAVTIDSISLAQPSLSTVGIPGSTQEAYIGLNGTISVDFTTGVVSVQTDQNDVTSGPYTFTGLTVDTDYRIIVVADSGSAGFDVRQIVVRTAPSPPVLGTLVIGAVDDQSITLNMVSYTTSGFPVPGTADAYIGLDGTITVTPLGVVGSSIAGPFDVDSAPHTFGGLTPDTTYRIIVVAQNASGVSIREITQTTGPSAPVLNPLAVSSVDDQNITLAVVGYADSGFPVPGAADAYIGLDGTITVTPLGVVGSSIAGPFDVDSAPHTFGGLTPDTTYRIIVVAQNASGVSIREITQTTGPSAPVLNPLAVSSVDDQNITLATTSYASSGFPVPGTADAYIGLDGTITVTPLGVVGSSIAGPFDVDSAPHIFGGLTPDTTYRIIVVAQNASGVSIREITQTTGPSAPVLDPLVVSSVDDQNITLATTSYFHRAFRFPGRRTPTSALTVP